MYEDLERDLVQRLDLLRDHVQALPVVRLVTLGPKGTSSDSSARYFLDQVDGVEKTLTLTDTYEEAASRVVAGEADLLLVANAYKGIDRLYMTPSLYFLCAYFFETPVYGIGALPGTRLERGRTYRIASHHAPVSLLPWFLEGAGVEYTVVDATSTAAAAHCVRTGAVDLCITNALGIANYDLEFVTRTRPIRMLWSVFEKKRPRATPSFYPPPARDP